MAHDTTQRPAGPESGSLPVGLIVAFVAAAALFVIGIATWKANPDGLGPAPNGSTPALDREGLERAGDAESFRAWLAKADAQADIYGFGNVAMRAVAMESAGTDMAFDGAQSAPSPTTGVSRGETGGATRVSGTNVQVQGIDEPDILKTDGKRLFYSPQTFYGGPWMEPIMFRGDVDPGVMMEGEAVDADAPDAVSTPPSTGSSSAGSPGAEPVADEAPSGRMILPPERRMPTMKVVDAFPPEDIALLEEIERTGELLLHEDTLSVFAYDGVYAYDVGGDAAEEAWSYDYDDDHQLVTARLRGDEIFLVLRAGIRRHAPCPISPLSSGSTRITVPCGDVWHPIAPVPSDVTYTVVAIDAASGEQRGAATFVGSWNSSAVYMSEDAVFGTWTVPPDTIGFVTAFVNDNPDLIPAGVRARINALSNLGISDRARIVELQVVLEDWMSSLGEDEMLRVSNELANRGSDFLKRRMRDFQRTGIVRISADGLELTADGSIPGALLNQFSLDAHEGHLRVATTIGGRGGFGWQFGFGGSGESVNDVYVLSEDDLSVTGSVTDLGIDERIYSARFVGDEAYVVTFREIDPFYVLDMSDPTAPRMTGELKIPGFSSYLHPITDDLVLGVGREEGQVKLSLFDVSDPSSPREAAKYLLDEHWSDVLNTHHAFLLDREHGVFFLPGGQGGYVFSYGSDSLELTKAVSDVRARRALYLDDYLYVVGDDRIIVLDQADWERVSELEFEEN